MDDCIYRQEAINALWKALYAYEDKTERQFIESAELDVGDWMVHRIFVQNMNDIDRKTILELPSVDAVEVVRCRDCKHADEYYQCDYSAIWNDKNHYCGKGERKDG